MRVLCLFVCLGEVVLVFGGGSVFVCFQLTS